MPKLKKSNTTFWVIFKQCEVVKGKFFRNTYIVHLLFMQFQSVKLSKVKTKRLTYWFMMKIAQISIENGFFLKIQEKWQNKVEEKK